MAYDIVFIQYGDKAKAVPAAESGNRNVEEPTDVAIKSNMELVAAASSTKVITGAEISVHYLADPLPGFRKVIEKMRASVAVWKRVRRLKIAMHPDSRCILKHAPQVAEHESDIRELGRALASLMPDVHQLDCLGVNNNPIARLLFGHLAGCYTERLTKIKTNHPLLVPHDRQFTKIRDAFVNYDNVCDYRLPSMNAAELERLTLCNGPANHSWAPFTSSKSRDTIAFPALVDLCVFYHAKYQDDGVAAYHQDGHPWTLQFPKLTSIRISCSADICPLLEYAKLPFRMDMVIVEMTSACFQRHAGVSLPAARWFELRVHRESGGDPIGLSAINRMLESARGSDKVVLKIGDRGLQLLPESITCTTLTMLSVNGLTDANILIELIQRLPNLTDLDLHRFTLGDIQFDCAIPDACDHEPAKPFDTKLKVVGLGCDGGLDSLDRVAAVVKYLLLKIPTLDKLLVAQYTDEPVLDFDVLDEKVTEFIEVYSRWYPHLESVSFIVDY